MHPVLMLKYLLIFGQDDFVPFSVKKESSYG